KLVRVWTGPDGREPSGEPAEVEWAHLHGKFVLVKLKGVDSMEAAGRLRNQLLFVPREETAPLPEGHFYIFDLVGLEVFTEDGELLGEVKEVTENPANDLFVVAQVGSGREFLVPALKSVVQRIDLAEGKMVVRLLPGLIEASEANRE
ncbi:MAG: ribosome maturation factor RimM, partial [Chitinophagales bacterium]